MRLAIYPELLHGALMLCASLAYMQNPSLEKKV